MRASQNPFWMEVLNLIFCYFSLELFVLTIVMKRIEKYKNHRTRIISIIHRSGIEHTNGMNNAEQLILWIYFESTKAVLVRSQQNIGITYVEMRYFVCVWVFEYVYATGLYIIYSIHMCGRVMRLTLYTNVFTFCLLCVRETTWFSYALRLRIGMAPGPINTRIQLLLCACVVYRKVLCWLSCEFKRSGDM